VFGYPLSAGETDEADLETVVEMVVEEGEGAHEGFPPDVPAEFFFDPVGVQVTPDDVIQFPSTAGLHTVTAFHEKYSEPPQFVLPTRIPDDALGFSSPPVARGESWLYQFPTAGVYDVLCLPHLGVGMVMRVVVMDSEDDVPSAPTGEFVGPLDEAVFTAPELDPENVVEEGTVAWEDLTIEVPEMPTGTPTETPTGTPTETEY
jgi:plastocyanin